MFCVESVRSLGVGLLVALVLIALGSSGYAQSATPASDIPDSSLAVEAIQQSIDELERSKDLDEKVKTPILELYREAMQDVLRATAWREKIQAFENEKRSADKNIEEAKSVLAGGVSKPPVAIPEGASVDHLEELLREAQDELKNANEKLTAAEVEPRRRVIRRVEVKQLLEEAKKRAASLESQYESLRDKKADTPLEQARRVRLQAALEAARLELAGYTKELETQRATTDLSPLQHDLAIQAVSHAEAKAKTLKEEVAKARKQETESQIRQAKQYKAMMSDPALRQLAEDNKTFVEDRQDLSDIIKERTDELAILQKMLARVEKDFTSVQDRLKNAKQAKTIALFLRNQRMKLPETQGYLEAIEERQHETLKVQEEIFELAEKRADVAELEMADDEALEEWDSELSDVAAYERIQAELMLLRDQKKYIDQLSKYNDQYFNLLFDLDTTEQNLIDKIREYRMYIDKQMLWIRSTFPIWDPRSWQNRLDIDLVLEPGFWKTTILAFLAELRSHYLLWGGAFVSLVFLFLVKQRAKPVLLDLGQRAESAGMRRFLPTIQAAILTGLLVTPITFALAFLCWRFSSGLGISDPVSAINAALWGTLLAFLPVDLFRQMCFPRGLAESHFDWPASATLRIRQALTRIIFIAIPLLFIAFLLYGAQDAKSQSFLSRICFIACLGIVVVTMHFLVRVNGEVFRAFLATQSERLTRRIFYVAYVILVLLPFFLIVIAALGYYYFTAWRFMQLWWATVVLMASLLVIGALVLRWILVTRRRLAIQRARQEREKALAIESAGLEGENVVEPQPVSQDIGPDLATISMQTKRLIYVILSIAAVSGLWLIWDDIFPAFGILKDVPLWTVSGDSPLAIARTITLADVAWSILIAVLTFVAARNIPGLLEMSLLHRLPIDKGVRFAITTVFRYVLVGIGVVWAFNHVGASWSKVQWILAAMSVGLGFGLQEIFANFASGMVILFERPIRIGDIITIGDATGKVSKIQMRATTIIDWDKKELVVPNKEFATGRLLNWTLTDSTNRLVIEVGVSYNSDPEQVREILLKCAADHPNVLEDPEPICIFREFGNSALMFSLRIYLSTMKGRLNVIHEMHSAVHRALREAGIEIAFPQLDLHVRSDTRNQAHPPLMEDD